MFLRRADDIAAAARRARKFYRLALSVSSDADRCREFAGCGGENLLERDPLSNGDPDAAGASAEAGAHLEKPQAGLACALRHSVSAITQMRVSL